MPHAPLGCSLHGAVRSNATTVADHDELVAVRQSERQLRITTTTRTVDI